MPVLPSLCGADALRTQGGRLFRLKRYIVYWISAFCKHADADATVIRHGKIVRALHRAELGLGVPRGRHEHDLDVVAALLNSRAHYKPELHLFFRVFPCFPWLKSLSFFIRVYSCPFVIKQSSLSVYTQTAKIDNQTSNAKDAIELMREYRIKLISAAVTGKIDVWDF